MFLQPMWGTRRRRFGRAAQLLRLDDLGRPHELFAPLSTSPLARVWRWRSACFGAVLRSSQRYAPSWLTEGSRSTTIRDSRARAARRHRPSVQALSARRAAVAPPVPASAGRPRFPGGSSATVGLARVAGARRGPKRIIGASSTVRLRCPSLPARPAAKRSSGARLQRRVEHWRDCSCTRVRWPGQWGARRRRAGWTRRSRDAGRRRGRPALDVPREVPRVGRGGGHAGSASGGRRIRST